MHHADRAAGGAVVDHRAGHGGDRRDAVARFRREAVAHHRTVRHSGRVDARLVHPGPGGQVAEQRDDKGDVVYLVVPRVAAAGAAVPREQLALEAAGSVRIDGKEPFAIREDVQRAPFLHRLGIAAPAVKDDDNRQRDRRGRRRRGVDKVTAFAAVRNKPFIVVARGQRRRTGRRGPRGEREEDGRERRSLYFKFSARKALVFAQASLAAGGLCLPPVGLANAWSAS